MAATLQCQPSIEEANQFLVITIRILAAVGFSYLLRRLYQSIMHSTISHRSLSGPGRDDGKRLRSLNAFYCNTVKLTLISFAKAAAEENIGITPNHDSRRRISLELDFDDFDIDAGDLGIRIPEPAYHPRGSL